VAKDDLAAVRPGSGVRLVGFPFPVEDFLVIGGRLPDLRHRPGAQVPASGAEIRRWLVKFREVKPAELVRQPGGEQRRSDRPLPARRRRWNRDDYVATPKSRRSRRAKIVRMSR
jgi:hypothetical protein